MRLRLSIRELLSLILLVASLSGCGAPSDETTGGSGKTQHDGNEVLLSAHSLLGPGDFEKFRPGRPKDEILNDVQWHGTLVEATEHQGKKLAAISYGIFGGAHSDRGTAILAVFVDDKFEKFVRWPKGDATIKIGNFDILLRAVDAESISASDLTPAADSPKQIDPGLTVAWLLEQPRMDKARKSELKKNSALRHEFNAAKLKIGMTESEVESALNAKPIQAGVVGAGTFKLYGSTEQFNLLPDLHYSNILVLLVNGKVSGIYSDGLVPGGAPGLRELRKVFTELPERE